MSYRPSAGASSLDDELDAPFAAPAAAVPTYSTSMQSNEQTTSYGGSSTDFHGRNGRSAKSASTAQSYSDNVDRHSSTSRASTQAISPSQSYSSIDSSADAAGCGRCASKDAKLEKYKAERSLLKAEVKASHAREKNLQEQLDEVTKLQDELQKEVNMAQQSQRASKLEIDNLLSSHASTKKNYELRLKEASEKIEKLNSEKAAKASSGWFGGSVLLGGGKSRADDPSASGGESDKKVKKLEADLELFQSQIQTQMQSYQQLYEKHEQLKNEANNRAETLTHTIGESRSKAEKAETERSAMEKELLNARSEAAEKERRLEAKLAELQSQVHSTLHSSSKIDQEWLQEKAVYEGILTELSQVWRSKIGFDDEQQPSRASTSLSLTLLPDRPNRFNMSCVLHSFNRVRYEIQREAVTSTQDQVWKLLSHTMNKTLLKHWKEKWSLQQSAPTAVAGVNPLSHVQGQPSSSHFTSLSKLSDTFGEKMTILQTNCKEVASALDILAGLKPAQDDKLSLLQSSALPMLTDLLKSPSALLEPLFAVLHCLASLAGLHAAVLEAGLSSHNFSAASNPAAYAAAAGMKNHVHTLAQGWSNLQAHLTRGAAALKKWCELNPNSSGAQQAMVSCPPFVHGDEPSTAVFVLPAAWPLEWIHTPAAEVAQASTAAAASPNSIAADVLAWFQTLHSLLTDVSSRFAVVSLHEQRTAATAAANAAAAHQSLDSGLDPTIHDPSVAAAAAAAESPAAVAIRSKLTEQNNLLLMGLNSLPKLAGSVVEVLKKGYERVQQLRVKQIQAEQFRENAWTASSSNDAAGTNSSSKSGLQVNSLPFASYLPSLSKLQPAALLVAQTSTPPPVQTLVHLHKRCTNFLSTLNASTVSSHTVNGLAYSFALQQQSDLAQLNAQFDILSERYRELQTEHEHLETLQRMLTNEQQLLLEKYEKTHDTFAETQLDYFEEKKQREQINKQLASTIKQLEEKSTELASHQALVDSNRVMIQRLEKQLARARTQLDPNVDVDNELDDDNQKAGELNDTHTMHTRLSDELRQSTLDFESSFAHVPTPMSVEEMVAAQQNSSFNYANLPDSTLRLNATPSLTDSASGMAIAGTDASVSEEEDSFFLQSLRHGESSTTRASQWLEQAKQFQSMLQQQQQQQQQSRNSNLVTPHKASSYSISFASNGPVGAEGSAESVAALPSANEDTVSALPMSSALVTPLTNRTVARRRTLGGASGLFSPPFLSHVSPDRFAPSPMISNEVGDEQKSLEQLNSWTLHQQQARHHASQLLLTQTGRQLDQLARSNAYLRHQQAQLAVVLNLLRTRSKEASQTAAATLSRLQEVQLERSESAQSYEAMMDELTERIFQLTQQLAEKDARAS